MDSMIELGCNRENSQESGRDVPSTRQSYFSTGRAHARELLIFSCPFLGVQLVYTIQQTFGLGYLSGLGFSDAQLPVLAFSGPIAGFLVPPIISPWSDNCQSRFGRRKPFVAVGGLGVILSFTCLAEATTLASLFTSPAETMRVARAIAGISIYTLNIFMQPFQLGLRAAAIDHFSPKDQPVANLWIGRFSSLGSVLVTAIAMFYHADFTGLSHVCIAILTLLLVLSLMLAPKTSWTHSSSDNEKSLGLRQRITKITRAWKILPPITRRVCKTQMFAWFTWFLLLQYTSTFISQAYASDINYTFFASSSDIKTRTSEALSRIAFTFHLGAFAITIIIKRLWNSGVEGGLDGESLSYAALHESQSVLVRAWKICLWSAAIWLPLVFFSAHYADVASVILAATGVLFAVGNWIPYALIGQEISFIKNMETIASVRGAAVPAGDENTVMVLAIYNMAITIPQMAASVLVWVVTKGLEIAGSSFGFSWIFLISAPFAVLATLMI